MAELSRLLGYGYHPTDQQIFSLLEKFKVDQKLMDEYNGFIHKCNLFGHKSEPSEIWEQHGGDQTHGRQLFFLSELKRSRKNISRMNISRKIGRYGTWSESGSKVIEHNKNPNPIGRIRNFRFENKRKSEDDARWLLQEYSLYNNTKASKNSYDFDFVICKMKRNLGENKRERSNDPNTNNVEEQQMAETLEDGPMRSVGSAWQGGPLQNHYPLTYPALDSDHQMDGNQEGYLIPSNYDDMLNEVPYEEGTSNYSSEWPCDVQLWSYQH